MQYDNIVDILAESGIEVFEMPLINKGLYADNVIAINNKLENTTEKKCILVEEIGHHFTSVGDILDQSKVANVKQERLARIFAYNSLIGIDGIIRAYEHGCKNRYEAADYLGVTEEFFENALDYYREKFGVSISIDNYIVYFEPNLYVVRAI